MTIILFLVDTSSSMCQKAYVNGVQKTYLDIAKGAVETFLKYRQRTQDCMGDRYMLLTFEEPPANVKAGWKENHATFMNELKNLQSTGLTSMGESLKNAFDLLNLNRMQSGIDTYGQGRCPFYLEPSVIIVITDGGRYSYRNGVHQEIILPLNTQIPGTKFTKEPFRWDQRLFSLVLRMSGNKVDERFEGKVPHDDSPIERMCEVTGGRSYRVRSQHVLNQCIESLVQKVQPGVVLQFEPMMPKDGSLPNEATQDIVFMPMKKMIYVPKIMSQKSFPIGYWPLPEPYWLDPKAVTLPPRDAHPKLKVVTPGVDEPQMVRSFPVDKYEVEASPLTLQILQKRDANKCWQVIISNGMHGFDLPFGYLKASPNLNQVHLFVLAYNYPALLPLLHDLIHKYNMSPPNDLLYKFNAYVRSIPPYYIPFLRKALISINVPYPLLQFLLPENADNYLTPNIANQLKHIKNTAKQDQENLCMKVYKQLKQPKPSYRQIETAKLNPGVPLRRDLVRHPLLRETFSKMHADIEPAENYTIVLPQLTRQPSAKSYRNPFDIPRRDLIEDIARMRESFLKPTPTSLIAKDSGHCLPISEMGNYQEYLKNKDIPLRELEPTNVRQHMFGNPYKKDKHMVMVDEADLGEVAAPMKANGNGNGPMGMPIPGMPMKKIDGIRVRKRKAGPIRKDFVFRRLSTDLPRPTTPNSSAASSSSSMVGSDYEDDSNSDASSTSSGISEDTDNETFDFNEEEQVDTEFPLNGHVRNFINGGDESSCDSEMSASTSSSISSPQAAANVATTSAAYGNLMHATNIALHSNGFIHTSQQSAALQPHSNSITPGLPYIPNTYGPPGVMLNEAPGSFMGHSMNVYPVQSAQMMSNPMMMSANSVYGLHDINGVNMYNSNNTTFAPATPMHPSTSAMATTPSAPYQTVASTSVTAAGATAAVAATSAITPSYSHHAQNDINDAQEISRILQQCHNGSSSSSTSYDISKTNNNETSTLDYDGANPSSSSSSSLTASPFGSSTTSAFSNSFDTLKREVNPSTTTPSNHLNTVVNSTSNHVNNQGNSSKRRGWAANNATAVAAAAAIKAQLTEEQRDAAKKHNLELRDQIFRDIRRPGRDYSQLLDHLSLIKGDHDMKSSFVQMCITESLRFRRKLMVNRIQEWWDKKQQQHQQQHQQLQVATS